MAAEPSGGDPHPVDPAIECIGLGRRFRLGATDVVAVRDVTLSIMPGEMVALCGPSGSGKSTLLNLLGLIDTPTSGRIRIAGAEIAEVDDDARTALRCRHIGLVFQDPNLIEVETARSNAALAAGYCGATPSAADAAALKALDDVGLAARMDHLPTELSGGEQQRVAIARALAADPAVLLCDEPTGNLDSATSQQIVALLRSRIDTGLAVVIVTHDDDVARQCTRQIRLVDGQLVGTVAANGSVGAMSERPRGAPVRPSLRWLIAQVVGGLGHGRRRSIATVLAIATAVAAVATVSSLAGSSGAKVGAAIDPYLSTEVAVDGDPAVLRALHWDAAKVVPDVEAAGLSYQARGGAEVSARRTGSAVSQAPVFAIDTSLLPAQGLHFVAGGWPVAASRQTDWALLPTHVARSIGVDGSTLPTPVVIDGHAVLVTGIYSTVRRSSSLLLGAVIAPPTAWRLMPPVLRADGTRDGLPRGVVIVQPGAAPRVGGVVATYLSPRRPAALTVSSTPDPVEVRQSLDRRLRSMITQIAGATLIAAMMAIAAVTSASAASRRREIALRRAVGARRRHVRIQIAGEAAVLGLAGGVVGAVFAAAGAIGVAAWSGWAPTLAVWQLACLPAIGLLVGAVGGVYPAWRASSIDPALALRGAL